MSKNKKADFAATTLGLLAAIANAWITIDWSNFNFENEYPKLILSGIIALGGYVSKIKQPTE